MSDEGLKIVFNFIMSIPETAIRSTPTVSPTKPKSKRDIEIRDFNSEIWGNVYRLYDKAMEGFEIVV